MRGKRLCIALGAFASAALTNVARAEPISRPANAVTLFAGQMTSNRWEDFLAPTNIRFRHAYFAGVGLTHRLTTLFGALDIEVLGQVAPHFGSAHQWEFDAAVSARWTDFSWNDVLPTSVAWGLGPSYETETPADEKAMDGGSRRLLAFWVAKLEIGLPESPWTGLVRIHHRSTASGLFGDRGGSNSVAIGVRRYF